MGPRWVCGLGHTVGGVEGDGAQVDWIQGGSVVWRTPLGKGDTTGMGRGVIIIT